MNSKPISAATRAAFKSPIKRPKTAKQIKAQKDLQDQEAIRHCQAVQVELKQAFLRRRAARTHPAPGATRPNAANGSLDGQDAT